MVCARPSARRAQVVVVLPISGSTHRTLTTARVQNKRHKGAETQDQERTTATAKKIFLRR
eukprot:scaffold53921_cov31-Tisochrysis_lutea.AAC.3